MNDAPKPKRRGPIMVELEEPKKVKKTKPKVVEKPKAQAKTEAAAFDPSSAPAVPDIEEPAPEGRAMTVMVTQVAKRRPSWIGRIFWGGLVGLLSLVLSVAAWDFVANLMARNPLLGQLALVFTAVVCVGLLALCLRELAAMSRLSRIDALRDLSDAAHRDEDSDLARKSADSLLRLYSGRTELKIGRETLKQRLRETLDAGALLHQAERNLLEPLDEAALREIEAASRTVATATALIPLALADVLAALTSNLRMVRRIAEIYGGRSGMFGSWRLMRAVATHLAVWRGGYQWCIDCTGRGGGDGGVPTDGFCSDFKTFRHWYRQTGDDGAVLEELMGVVFA